MTYELEVSEGLYKVLKSLGKKDRKQLEQIHKKVVEIRRNPELGKPLKKPLQGRRRVHMGSFVLIYYVDEARRVVRLLEYDHHDKVY
jgi:mRNA-degrading endonuclease RelE of RelBE toxin-antitoxin system